MKNENIINKTSIFGCLPKALFGNFVLGILVLIAGALWGGPKMAISPESGRGLFLFFFILYCAVTLWSILSLAEKRKMGQLQTAGAFEYVRHPMYGAIIFLLNPAMAFLLRSWFLLLVTLPVYFIWKRSIFGEERELVAIFGKSYLRYQASVWAFFPNLFAVSNPLFLAILGLVVFAAAFIILNLPAFYLHWVDWEKEAIAPQLPPLVSELPFSPGQEGPAPGQKQKYEKADSVVIGKIRIDAPLVIASGTTQKELNQALNQGVIVYPGSVLPGATGNLFLTGHSSVLPWIKTDYGQIFAQLDRLEAGDKVIVYFQKEKFEYEILNKEVLPSNQVILKHEAGAQTLTLMTCWPIGTSLKRLVIKGILVE